MDQFQYLALLLGCMAVTIPLEFFYGFRVWRAPKRAFRAILPGFVLLVCWDLLAISRGHWTFSDQFVTGWEVPGGIPIEELAFFVVIPMAAISGYEAVKAGLAKMGRTSTPEAGSPNA
jgi:lycopene beta-cyclase